MDGAVVLLMLLAAVGAVAAVSITRSAARERERQAKLQAEAERKRVEECGRVVLDFANHVGYIARQVISKDELETLIDQGISPDRLGTEISRRIDDADGMIIGYQGVGGGRLDVKLTQDFRDRHVYVIGKSGAGKTTLLRTMIMQDLRMGSGLAVIAPEAEMLHEELLPFIPDDRIGDVIYFNPADQEVPVPFNPLYLDEGEDPDLKVDELLTIFRRILGEPGPRMDEILRQTFGALVARAGSTLLDVERLLDRSDDSFRTEIMGLLEPRSAHFWKDIYPSFPKDAHLPITNRLGRFLGAKSVRAMLCNPHQSLNFREAMDSGKVMLFNVSDGLLGEQNSQLLGQLIVAKFQLAVMSRAQLAKHERRNFYLYIDESQTFTGTAGTSYEKILSRARKYKLGLVLAHQQTGQIPGSLLKEILGNVSTTICFNVSREDAGRFSREFVTEYNGEILNVPEEEILRLNVGQAWCKMGRHAFLMHTYLPKAKASSQRATYVIEQARANYGQRLLEAPAAVRRAGVSAEAPAGGILDDLDPGKVFLMPALTERDVAVLLDVHKFRYLTVSQIARLHFPSRQTAYRRLRSLTGLKLLTAFTAPTLTEHMYFLSKAGAAAVAGTLGLPADELPWSETFRAPKDYYFLCHFVQVTDFRITLTASCGSSGIKLLGFIPEYLASRATTGGLSKHIKDYVCDVSRPTEQLNHTPDAAFALERDGVPALFFLEIDRGTEVVGNPDKGVLKACRFYMSYLLSSAFQRYGQDFACAPFRGFRALFVTTSESRLQNIRQAVSALDPAGKAKKFIWLALFSEVAENITDIPWRSADAADTATYRIA